jgi:hypothetical protein
MAQVEIATFKISLENLNLTLGEIFTDGLDVTFNDIAENAGMSVRETVFAAMKSFSENRAEDFEKNPRSLEYQFATAEEDAALSKAHGWQAPIKNPKDLTAEELATVRRASLSLVGS